jgi:uncharacterized protein (DUF4415 family)
MAIIKSTVKAGQKPNKAEMARIRKELGEAKKRPINLQDCPELPPEALKEFAFMAAERNKQQRRQAVTIRVVPGCLSKYKALGKGYTGIMADVLNYVADNPAILKKIQR